MYIIRKQFSFSAAHHLLGLPKDHPCSANHGHNYTVTVELRSIELNEVGFVTDYRDLQPIKTLIDKTIDHKDLNEVFPDMNPTAERIAKRLYYTFKPEFPKLYAVEVSETEKTMARYQPDYD